MSIKSFHKYVFVVLVTFKKSNKPSIFLEFTILANKNPSNILENTMHILSMYSPKLIGIKNYIWHITNPTTNETVIVCSTSFISLYKRTNLYILIKQNPLTIYKITFGNIIAKSSISVFLPFLLFPL